MSDQSNQCRALIRRPVFSLSFRETLELRSASYSEVQQIMWNATVRALRIPASVLSVPSSYSSFSGIENNRG